MRGNGAWAPRTRGRVPVGRAAPASVAVLIVAFGLAGCSAGFSSASQSVHVNAPSLRHLVATLTDEVTGSAGITQVHFSQDGRTLAAVDLDGGMYRWNTATRKLIVVMDLVPSNADIGRGTGVPALSPDAETLAVGDEGGQTYVWDTATGDLAATLTDPAAPYPRQPVPTSPVAPPPQPQGVFAVAFSQDGQTLAVADSEGFVDLYDMSSVKAASTGKPARPSAIANMREDVDSLAFSPDGRTLAVGEDDGETYLWSTATHSTIAKMADDVSDEEGMHSLAFSPDGRILAGAAGDGETYLWDAATHAVTATLTEPYPSDIPGQVDISVAFSPDGRTLATSDGSGAGYLWDVATHRIIATVPDVANQGITDVVFSPDGRTLAAADGDSTYLWAVPY